MHVVHVNCWEDFEDELRNLSKDHTTLKQQAYSYVSGILYRGHANHTWDLTTSLERFCSRRFSVDEYYKIISVVKPDIESVTDTEWIIPTPAECSQLMTDRLPFLGGGMPGYEYMAYLRHNGFPSPLLDWTRSPYVAAYFAFAEILGKADMVSIFAYQEYAGKGKISGGDTATISSLGPSIKTHRRHYLQQSEYTVCTVKENNVSYYASHESAFTKQASNQDLLWKFIIPFRERTKVLKVLDAHNLNAFSLFGSTESLMKTLALRKIDCSEQG